LRASSACDRAGSHEMDVCVLLDELVRRGAAGCQDYLSGEAGERAGCREDDRGASRPGKATSMRVETTIDVVDPGAGPVRVGRTHRWNTLCLISGQNSDAKLASKSAPIR